MALGVRIGLAITGILIVLVGYSLYGILTKPEPPKASTSPTAERISDVPTKDGACHICEQFVLDRLLSPQSAEFGPWDQSQVIVREDGVYVVGGYVDHRNKYNVPVRTKYACAVRYRGNKEWGFVALETR